MSFINIFVKELKQFVRNKRVLLMMMLFPIVLITILGNALKNMMGDNGNSTIFNNVKILYYVNEDSKYKNLLDEFISYGEKNLKVTFTKADNIEDGKKSVSQGYDGFIVSEKDSDTVYFYKNQIYSLGGTFVEKALSSFVERYNIVYEIYKVNPMGAATIQNEKTEEYTKITSITPDRVPNSIDYYSVAELTLIIMYLSVTMMNAVRSERISKTEDRILATPASKWILILGKVAAGVVIGIMQCIVVYLFSKYVLNAYWGNNLINILLILLSFIFVNVMLGTTFALIFKDIRVADGILNVVIVVFVALGGGYTPLETLQSSELMSKVIKISPVYWTNISIFQNAFGNGSSPDMMTTIFMNIIIALMLMSATVFLLNRRGRG